MSNKYWKMNMLIAEKKQKIDTRAILRDLCG